MKAYLYEVWKTNSTDIRECLVLSESKENSEDILVNQIDGNDEYRFVNEIETVL